jgi:hypothetical protein
MNSSIVMLWDHPFKTSPFSRGEGGSPLPTLADARGVGVSGMPTSAVFCNYQETNSNFFYFKHNLLHRVKIKVVLGREK